MGNVCLINRMAFYEEQGDYCDLGSTVPYIKRLQDSGSLGDIKDHSLYVSFSTSTALEASRNVLYQIRGVLPRSRCTGLMWLLLCLNKYWINPDEDPLYYSKNGMYRVKENKSSFVISHYFNFSQMDSLDNVSYRNGMPRRAAYVLNKNTLSVEDVCIDFCPKYGLFTDEDFVDVDGTSKSCKDRISPDVLLELQSTTGLAFIDISCLARDMKKDIHCLEVCGSDFVLTGSWDRMVSETTIEDAQEFYVGLHTRKPY